MSKLQIQKEDEQYLWIQCINPKHKDINPSMCINKIDTEKYPIGFAYCYGCSYTAQFSEETIKKMSKKKSICREKKPIDWEELVRIYCLSDVVDRKSFKLAVKWKVSSFGQYDVGYDGEALTIPMRNENEEIVGISRRFPDGSKSCMEGSQLGLFISMMRGYRVVITEGFSDAAVASHLGYFGIGKPCASFGEELVRKYLENIKYNKEVIIVEDNDEAGQRSSEKLQSVLQNWKVEVVVPETDLKAYYLKYGFDQTVSLLELG